ncbi:MAG: MFS transporter [Fluviibacter sp.]
MHAIFKMPRTVWLIGLISFMNDSASEMLYPLIPLYLASTLMAGPRALGLIEGVADATSSLLKLVSGVLVDKTKRIKPWLFFGYGLAGLSRPLVAFAGSWVTVLFIRFADRLGKGLRSSPRDALLADSVASHQRGMAYGFHRAMDNGGAVVGPLLAYALLSMQVPIPTIFLLAIIPAAICLTLVGCIREPRQIPPESTPLRWNLSEMPTSLKRFLIVVALFSLGNSSNIFLLFRAKELGVPEAYIPLLWAIVSLIAALGATPLAALSDRIGRFPLLFGGYLAFALVYLSLGFLNDGLIALALIFGLYGLFVAATEGVEKALVADLAPSNKRGTAFGWFNMTVGIFLLPSSVIFGELYERLNPNTAFGFSATCALLACGLLWYWFKPTHAARNPS